MSDEPMPDVRLPQSSDGTPAAETAPSSLPPLSGTDADQAGIVDVSVFSPPDVSQNVSHIQSSDSSDVSQNVSHIQSSDSSDVSQNVSHAPTRIAGRNGGALTPFDPDRARAARLRQIEDGREELRQAALAAGTLAAAQIPDLPSNDRVGLMTSILSNHALNAHDPSARGSVASARLVIETAYPHLREFEREQPAPISEMAQAMGVELARLLLARVRQGEAEE